MTTTDDTDTGSDTDRGDASAVASRLLAATEHLVADLEGRAIETEELRRLPQQTVDDFASADLYQILVPERWGGHELEFAALADVVRTAAHGDTSSAWILGFYGIHNWMMCLLPEQAQDEIFADRPYALAPATFAPNGVATPVEGGFQLSGRWSWGSGVMHADWVMVAGRVEDAEGPSLRVFLLPADDVTVEDVWFTSGMRGTGSNDVVVEDQFVPEYRTVSFVDILNGTTPGAALHDSSVFRWPLVPMLALVAAAPALGTAEVTLERFRERVSERVIAYTAGAKQRDQPAAQIRLGKAAAHAIAARAMFDGAIAEIERLVADGVQLDADARATYRLIAAHVVHLSRQVITSLSEASGGSAHMSDSPFQRALRDVNTLAGHVIFDYDATAELYGRVQVGLDIPKGVLV